VSCCRLSLHRCKHKKAELLQWEPAVNVYTHRILQRYRAVSLPQHGFLVCISDRTVRWFSRPWSKSRIRQTATASACDQRLCFLHGIRHDFETVERPRFVPWGRARHKMQYVVTWQWGINDWDNRKLTDELKLLFGVRKSLWYLVAHEIADGLRPEKPRALSLPHHGWVWHCAKFCCAWE